LRCQFPQVLPAPPGTGRCPSHDSNLFVGVSPGLFSQPRLPPLSSSRLPPIRVAESFAQYRASRDPAVLSGRWAGDFRGDFRGRPLPRFCRAEHRASGGISHDPVYPGLRDSGRHPFCVFKSWVPQFDQWSLLSPINAVWFILLLGGVFASLYWYRNQMLDMDKRLTFEDLSARTFS